MSCSLTNTFPGFLNSVAGLSDQRVAVFVSSLIIA